MEQDRLTSNMVFLEEYDLGCARGPCNKVLQALCGVCAGVCAKYFVDSISKVEHSNHFGGPLGSIMNRRPTINQVKRGS